MLRVLLCEGKLLKEVENNLLEGGFSGGYNVQPSTYIAVDNSTYLSGFPFVINLISK